MNTLLWALILGLAMVALGAIKDAPAQAPPPTVTEGAIYSVTYVEVLATSTADGIALLRRYREATRQEDGNLRCEVVSRIGQPHQLVVLEVWRDQKAFEAHSTSSNTVSTRERIHAIRGAPIDERVHLAVASGPLQPGPAGDAVYVVTHVDVIPPRKDDGLAAVKQLADASRPEPRQRALRGRAADQPSQSLHGDRDLEGRPRGGDARDGGSHPPVP